MDDVLVLVGNCGTWQPHVRYAARLAAKLHGSLNGIHVAPSAIPVPTDASAAFSREIIEIFREETELALRAETPFKQWGRREGIEHSTWRVARGSPAEVLESAAKWHDLVILEAHAESFGGDILETGSAIVRVDLPCVVVPRGMDKANLDTIAIAWNGSIQSARAVHAALPLLQQARRIAILRVDDADATGAIDRIEPDEFLGRHGLRCEHFDMRGRADDAGAALLAGAAQIFADLLVLGAYGTGRFSEWIFGGVTRHVLQHVTLPLFMRH